MKCVTSLVIEIYKRLFSPILVSLFGNSCRYEETCSSYTQRKVLELGALNGLKEGVKRFSTCHPYSKRYTD